MKILRTYYNARGFTLIELLVVIAIIGILSSVVLASLSSARTKAYDAKVKGQLSSLRTAGESYYVSNGNYGTATSSCNPLSPSSTTNFFADTSSGLAPLAVSVNYPVGENTIQCYSSGSAWAASDNMSGTGNYWCVDSNGASKKENAALATSTVSCP